MKNLKLLLLTVILIGCQNPQTKKTMATKKIVIAHRGASGYLPEHTLTAKAMAYAMHPDYLEQDIVLSKDDVPIVIHDITLDDVTDVAKQFPDRKREDGKYYVIDFTYSELLRLNVTERFDTKTGLAVFKGRFPIWKSHFKLHSLQDEIEMIQGLNKSTGRNIGIYPEIKAPKFHRNNGKDISKIVLKVLSDYSYKTKKDNCILQCFDATELKRIRQELKSKLFLVQLTEFKEDNSKLAEFAKYADGMGPYFKQLIKRTDPKTGTIVFNNYVKNAHKLGMVVHAYTFRADQLEGLPSFEFLLDLGFNKAHLDGIFTDFSDKAVAFFKKQSH
ncbi:MAG: glycerophosphodiester phosphodiesterase [Flavobacteriaceae bacterium]|nr:glycerophosphodiester phosphodiesterase [Flavobacteriaceae bacterium]